MPVGEQESRRIHQEAGGGALVHHRRSVSSKTNGRHERAVRPGRPDPLSPPIHYIPEKVGALAFGIPEGEHDERDGGTVVPRRCCLGSAPAITLARLA